MLVRYNAGMTTLTIRIDEELKQKAFEKAEKFGVPLTLIVKNALRDFVDAEKITIGKPEEVIITPELQKKINKIGQLIN